MIRVVLWLVMTSLIGLVVHLASMLAIPTVATKNGFQRLAATTPAAGFTLLPAPLPSESMLPMPDPALSLAACRYDLDQGPLHVRVPLVTYYMAVSGYKLAAHGVIPDYPIKHTIEDLIAGTDKDIEMALQLARK